MTTTAWAPDHAPVGYPPVSPEAVDSPPTQARPTGGGQVPVEQRAQDLCANVVRTRCADLAFPVERYEGFVYWRTVFEQAAQEMTLRAGHELAQMADGGLSARKISTLLAEAGLSLSPSGVEQAIKRARAAAAEAEMEMES